MRAAALCAVGLVLTAGTPGHAAPTSPAGASSASASARASTGAQAEESPQWRELKLSQQSVLAPLQAEWSTLDVRNKRKWIELAARFPGLTPPEQARVQARMSEWARMTPVQRGAARLHYQQARQLGAGERQARWDAYQALPPAERQQLAERSASAPAAGDPSRRDSTRPERGARTAPVGTAATLGAAAPIDTARRPISPALVQATPGATTTLIDRRPTPPEHQRAGTRIHTSPDEINRTTLAPRHRPFAGTDTAASSTGPRPAGASGTATPTGTAGTTALPTAVAPTTAPVPAGATAPGTPPAAAGATAPGPSPAPGPLSPTGPTSGLPGASPIPGAAIGR